jgi:hypothetical protein
MTTLSQLCGVRPGSATCRWNAFVPTSNEIPDSLFYRALAL